MKAMVLLIVEAEMPVEMGMEVMMVMFQAMEQILTVMLF